MMNCPFTNSEEAYALVGDPVNVITGANVDRALDFQMPGSIRLQWVRHYDSAQCRTPYALGWGHTHGYDRRLIFDTDGLRYVNPLGAAVGFPALMSDGERFTRASLSLHRVSARLFRIYQYGAPVMEFDFRDQLVTPVSRLIHQNASINFHYDQSGRLDMLTDSSLRRISVRYNPEGLLAELSMVGEGARSSRPLLNYRYDQVGNLVWIRDPYGSESGFCYDQCNRLVKRTDRRGYSFLFEYDSHGRCIRTTGEDGLHDTRLEYLAQEEITIVTKADGGTWTYLHPGGKLIRIIDPKGASRELVRHTSGKLLEEMDENQNVSKIVYGKGFIRLGKLSSLGAFSADGDAAPPANAPHRMPDCPLEWQWGNLLDRKNIVLPSAEDALFEQFGPAAKLVHTAEQFQTPQKKFDDFGLLIQETHLRGAPRRWIYDANGNTQRYYDHDGRPFRFEYSSWNHRIGTIDPLANATLYEFTPLEQVSAVVDPAGARSEYGYDQTGRLVEVRRHGVVKERYRYDLAGNLVEKLDADSLPILSFEIGPHNLKKSRSLASGDVHTFTYTDKGELASASTNEASTEFSYDKHANRTRDERDGRGVEHVFTGPGRLKQTIVFKKFHIAYERHPSGALLIIDPAGNRHSVRSHGNVLMERTFSNRTSEAIAVRF